MRKKCKNRSPANRPRLPAMLAVAVVFSIGACDGGTQAGFTSSARVETTILPTYGYRIGATAVGGPLSLSIPGVGGAVTIAVDLGNTLDGELNVSVDADNDLAIVDYSLHSTSGISVDSDRGLPYLGAFDIEVTEDMQFAAGQPPAAGTLRVVTPAETVRLRALMTRVELRFATAAPMIFTWEALESLLDDDSAPAWQRRAALAVEILEFVFDRAFGVAEALNLIDGRLAAINPLVGACDAFTGSPPAGVLAQGESTFTWMGSGSYPGDGDDFDWSFTDCWFDDPANISDILINGSIDLHDYVEVVDSQYRLIRSGFAVVVFKNLTIAATVERPPGIFVIDAIDTVTVSGSFELALAGFTG